MNDQTKTQHAALINFHNKADEIVAKLKNPTKESVENALKAIKSPDGDTIMSYTGYYSMDAGTTTGAFLSIDTTEYYYKLSQNITVRVAAVSVTVSMDGTTSKTYPLDQSTTFIGTTLTIPNVLKITLTRGYNNGILTTFSGQVNSVNVTGSTRFNPITLSTFNGNYTAVPAMKKVLSVNDSTTIPYKSTIAFDFGAGLQEIRSYTFTPLMFVLMFTKPGSQDKYVLMMGTAGTAGLACFIQHGTTGEYAVTIP